MCRRGALTVSSINMSHFLNFTTWQAGQTRKGFTNLPLPVGNSQTLFHTSCGYAFLQNAELLSRQYPENQKKPEPGADKIDSWLRMSNPYFPFFLLAAIPHFHFCSTSGKFFFVFHRPQALVLCGVQSLSTQDFLQKDAQSVSSLFSNPLL